MTKITVQRTATDMDVIAWLAAEDRQNRSITAPEMCRNCDGPIVMICYRNTPWCCQACERAKPDAR